MDTRPPGELDTLYHEAVALADRARGWFDGPGLAWRSSLPARAQATVATEGLATTARLMATIAWLLDPCHARQQPPRALAFSPAAESPLSPLLAETGGGKVAEASRLLFARIASLAPPGLRAGAPKPAAVLADTGNAGDSDRNAQIKGLWRT